VEKRTSPKIIGIGGLQGKNGGLMAVKNGIIDVTFLNPTGGAQAVRCAIEILKGNDVPREVELQTKVITRENVDQFIKDTE
jgi:ABC-type sugar transport system substrate-binding protein